MSYGFLHRVTDEVEIGGYIVPPDTIIVPNLYMVHHDPEYWTDPDSFCPERWLSEDGTLITHKAFIPFSTGLLTSVICNYLVECH